MPEVIGRYVYILATDEYEVLNSNGLLKGYKLYKCDEPMLIEKIPTLKTNSTFSYSLN